MTHGSSDAVCAGVTTSNDNNVFVLGADICTILKLGVEEGLGVELFGNLTVSIH